LQMHVVHSCPESIVDFRSRSIIQPIYLRTVQRLHASCDLHPECKIVTAGVLTSNTATALLSGTSASDLLLHSQSANVTSRSRSFTPRRCLHLTAKSTQLPPLGRSVQKSAETKTVLPTGKKRVRCSGSCLSTGGQPPVPLAAETHLPMPRRSLLSGGHCRGRQHGMPS